MRDVLATQTRKTIAYSFCYSNFHKFVFRMSHFIWSPSYYSTAGVCDRSTQDYAKFWSPMAMIDNQACMAEY